ncbi:MAG: hypothetical protein QM741_17860 [Rudaea sp.]|uniref:hypothetical protein n=1 Tax=Rudaea sp. TaxID=2136325 RepID=UPI0039E6BA8C
MTIPPPFDANQFGLTGTWYDPKTSGQGLVIEVYPDPITGVAGLFGGWFTFDSRGNPQWRTLQGQLASADGAMYALDIYTNTGGNFNAPPKATAVADGTATLAFSDCGHATLVYQLADGSGGTIDEVNLVASGVCSNQVPLPTTYFPPFGYEKSLLSGAWYDPQTSGQGFVFDVSPGQSLLFGAWYTYAPQAEGQSGEASQRWFTLQAPYTYISEGLSVTHVPVYAVTGGRFNQASNVTKSQVGTADITFTSCTTLTIDYTFTDGEFAGLSGSLDEQKIVPNPGCH